ncbi:MAG: MFS transporter, partial [Acidobacteriota bacterium]
GSGLVTLAIAGLVLTNRLEVWHLYGLLTISSFLNAFQFPAFSSSVTLLVKREDLGRAAGMSQLGPAISMVLAPMIAPVLLATLGLFGIMVIDAVTFVFAVGTLLVVRIPRPKKSEAAPPEKTSLLQDAAFGWTYIRARSGLLGLLFLLAGGNLVLGFLQVLLVPIALERWSPHILGLILGAAAAGTVAGGLIMSVWRGPRRRVHWILGLLLFQGLVLIVGAPVHSAFALGVVVFVYMLQVPIIAALSQAIWQTTVEPDLQGRVFAVRRMMALIAKPLAFAVAGPLSDHVFEPLLMADGPLAPTLGPLIGVGNGRGTALFAMGLGLLLALAVARAYFYKPLRELQAVEPESLPDIEPLDPPRQLGAEA